MLCRYPQSNAINPNDTSVEFYSRHHDASSNESSEDSRPIQVAASSYPAADPVADEVDVIEELLSQDVRRKGATGNTTTLYNCRIEHDPNEGFDPAKEEGEVMYLIKWRGWSHIHSTWETEASLTNPDRGCPVDGLRRLYVYQDLMAQKQAQKATAGREELENILYEEERNDVILQEKMEVDRIVSHSREQSGSIDYLCKWRRLDYQFSTWESGKVIRYLYPKAVEDYQKRCESTKLPNFRREAFSRRPKFMPIPKQPDYIGDGNPDLRLRDYQLKGLNWIAHAWTRGNSVILADEMGLGKTVQAISFLNYLFNEHGLYGPFLIVVPLSTISSWQREFELWAPQFNLIVYVGSNVSRQTIRDYEWSQSGGFAQRRQQRLKFNICMTTYEILLKDKAFLSQVSWASLIVDEAHRLKNDASQLYKALFAFDTDTRLLVTGTPLQNSLKELWSLLHFLKPEAFGNWEDFEEEYSFPSHIPVSDSHDGFSRLHRVLEPYLLRRIKKDVEQSLPAKTERILRVEMSKRQATLYRLILTRNYDGLMKVTGGHKTSFINIVMELKKCCNHANLIDPPNSHEAFRPKEEVLRDLIRGSGKLMLLDKLLQKLRPQGHRVLIFSQMVRMLDIIADYLTLRGWGFQRLDGSIRGEIRKQTLDHFNAEGSTDFCFLLSTRAGGLGINLATADTVIIFDSDWNPQNDLQAQARAHRIGQTKQVSVYRLVVKESVEEKIIESATRKMLLDFLVIQRMDSAANRGGHNRKSDPKGKLLTDILKHGAESIFKQNDEEMADIEVDIDDILNTAETRTAENEDDSHGLLSAFNVVNLNQLEEDDLKPVQVDAKSSKSWSEIIPEEMRRSLKEAEDRKAIVDLSLGPRLRKQVKAFHAGVDRAYSSSDSGSEGGQNEKKYVHLNPKDIRAILRALKRFPRPLERIEAIAAEAELPSLTNEEVADVVESIINGCKSVIESAPDDDNETNAAKHRGPVYNYGKVAIPVKSVLQSLDNLEVLYQVLPKTSKEDRLSYELPFVPRYANWPNQWNAIDDAHLLVGVYEHGYDNWDAIKLDADLGLGSKLIPINSNERPQASHVRARVDYLLKMLKKHSSNNNGAGKPKTRGKSSNEHKKYAKRATRHNHLVDSSRPVAKPKSAEFVESDDTSSNSEAGPGTSSKSGIPPLRIKKTSKRHMKVGSASDQPSAKRFKQSNQGIKDEPVHYTASPIAAELTKEEEADFRNMVGPLFAECKERFHPFKRVLKQMRNLESGETIDTDKFNEVLLEIGTHIREILGQMEDRAKRHKWKRICWLFLENFSSKSASELECIHHDLRKSNIFSKREEASSRHSHDDRDHRHRHHHRVRHEDDDRRSYHHHNRFHHRRDNSTEHRVDVNNGSNSSNRHSSNIGERKSGGDWSGNRRGFSNSMDRVSKHRDNRNDRQVSFFPAAPLFSFVCLFFFFAPTFCRFNNAFNRSTSDFNDAFNNPGLRDYEGRSAVSSNSSIPPPYSFQRSVAPSSQYSWPDRPTHTAPLLPSPSAVNEGSIIPPPIASAPRDPRLWTNRS